MQKLFGYEISLRNPWATQAGLTVRASLLEGEYAKGQKVSDTQMQQLNIEFAEVCSRWNYTLRPRPQILPESDLEPEVIS
jgi:hypothetical protein